MQCTGWVHCSTNQFVQAPCQATARFDKLEEPSLLGARIALCSDSGFEGQLLVLCRWGRMASVPYKDDSAHAGTATAKDPMRSMDSGEARMAAMGYQQELKRSFNLFTNFGISFGIISILTGVTGRYARADIIGWYANAEELETGAFIKTSTASCLLLGAGQSSSFCALPFTTDFACMSDAVSTLHGIPEGRWQQCGDGSLCLASPCVWA